MNLLSYTLFSVGPVNPSELVAATEGASALSTIQNDGAARTLCEEKIHAESAPFVVSSDYWVFLPTRVIGTKLHYTFIYVTLLYRTLLFQFCTR